MYKKIIYTIQKGSKDKKIPLIVNSHGLVSNNQLYLYASPNNDGKYVSAETFLKKFPDIFIHTKPFVGSYENEGISLYKDRYSIIIFTACGGKIDWSKSLIDNIGIPITYATGIAGGIPKLDGSEIRKAVIVPNMAHPVRDK